MQKINPCLWFDNQALEGAKLYSSLFANSKVGQILYYGEEGALVSGQKEGSVLTVELELAEQKIVALNGGPYFKFTPALSFFVWCESEAEIESLWKRLSKNGQIRMELGKYPWSEKYGWTADAYGVEWQLIIATLEQKVSDQKFAPAFLFVKEVFGKGEEAINFYMSLFEGSQIKTLRRDDEGKSIMHCVFSLAGQDFVLMEGKGEHNYTFSNAFSFIINCQNQQEIDFYWEKLSQGGSIEQCGWLKDKYGVSWQIVPTLLSSMLQDPDNVRSERVMKAMLSMKKIDINVLKQTYEQ